MRGLATVCVVAVVVSARAQAPDLVEPTASGRLMAFHPAMIERDVMRARGVVIKPTLAQKLTAVAGGKLVSPLSFRVAFFDDATMNVVFPKCVVYRPEQVSYIGNVEGQPLTEATMSVVRGVVVLDVRLPSGLTYQLRPSADDGNYVAKEVVEAKQAPCGVHQEFIRNTNRALSSTDVGVSAPGPSRSVAAGDATDEADVLIGYTRAARIAAGGTDAIVALANQGVTMANGAYANSQTPFSIRAVWIGEVDYVEDPTDMSVDLDRLQKSTDGYLAELTALREVYRADLVTLLVKGSAAGVCGIGYLMTTPGAAFESNAYSVVSQTCINNHTFAHELAHNMGCSHARGDGGETVVGSHSYSFGHRWTGLSNTTFRSVMAYAPGQRVRYFSNPNVLFDGVATGVAIGQPNEAFNARTLELNAPSVTNWRQRKTTDTARVVATSRISLGSVPAGGNVGARDVWVGNSGTGAFSCTVTSLDSWISVIGGASPTTVTESLTRRVIMDVSKLPVGSHSGIVLVTAPGVSGSPRAVPITVDVVNGLVTNDVFRDAFPVAGGEFTTSTSTAGFLTELGEPSAVAGKESGATAWWTWRNTAGTTAPATVRVTSASFDAQLSVYTGTSVEALTVVGEADLFSPLLEQVTFQAVPGETYYFRVAGKVGGSGSVSLSASLPTAARVADWNLWE